MYVYIYFFFPLLWRLPHSLVLAAAVVFYIWSGKSPGAMNNAQYFPVELATASLNLIHYLPTTRS